MKKRIISLLITAAIITTFAGCSDKSASSDGSSQTSESSQTSSDSSTGESTPSVLTAGIAADTIIASPENGAENLAVRFDAFLKEYKYYLAGTGLDSDTNEAYAETLRERREYIANYLINEQVILAKFDEYGLSLSDEDMEKIKADAETNRQTVISQLCSTIKAATSEQLDEDAVKKQAEQQYSDMLQSSGLTDEDILNWQITTEKQNKLSEVVNKDFTYDYSEAEKNMETVVEKAKSQYEESPESFNTSSFGSIWLPEGTRSIKQILIMFDDDTLTQISELRVNGDDEAADKLRAEKAPELEAELAEVQAKIDAGEDFDALMNQYSDDGDTTISYTVAPKTGMYITGFADCVFSIENIGGVKTCLTDYGYHIIKYVDDAVVSEETYKASTDDLYEYLKNAYLTTNFNKQMTQWLSEYNYTIDRELLLLG